jgi:iron complex outermembrane recepter protein
MARPISRRWRRIRLSGRWLFACASVGLVLAGLCALAQLALAATETGPLLWPTPCDTVDIVARRPWAAERIAPARGFVQIIPLGARTPASADLGDLLDRAAGVSVRRYGGLGSMSLASIRGSSPSQVQIYIDDVPLSTASDAVANLALLPVHLFESMEVASGPLTGGSQDAAAGSIRLNSPADLDAPLRFRVGAGSFGTMSFSGAGGGTRGPLSVLLAGGRLSSHGDYRYLDRGGTRWESSDDRVVRRANNAFRQDDLLLRARVLAHRNVQVETIGHGLWKDAGVPGTENLQTRDVHDRFRRWLQSLAVGTQQGDAPGWKLRVHRQDDVDRYRNLKAEVGLGRADTRSHLVADGLAGAIARESRTTARTQAGNPLVAWKGRLDAAILRERWTLVDVLRQTTSPTRERSSRSAGIEGGVRVGRLGLTAAERWLSVGESLGDGVSRDRSLPHGRAGASLDVGHGVVLRGSWGRTLRLPSFTELFGVGGIQVGNPDLVPERGTAWDAGVNFDGTPAAGVRTSIEATAFGTRSSEAIVWIQNSQRTARPQNLERTYVRGTQLLVRSSWALRPRSMIGLTFSGTLQDARDDGPSTAYHGKRLPYQPARQASIETRYDTSTLRLTFAVDSESSIERDRYNTIEHRRSARTMQDAGVEWKLPGRSLRLGATVKNLTNRRAQDVDGFPLPGRSVLLELTWAVR